MSLTLDEAILAIEGAKKRAKEINVPMVIAVVDAGGNLIAKERMDGALLISIGLSENKAYTSAFMKRATHDLAPLAQPGAPLYGIHNAEGGRIVIFGGGIPLVVNEQVIGAIGVSGGAVEQDAACARAGAEALGL